ncbi:cytochrome c [Polymorphobacter multimanifer]|uniref:Cytochrome c n=1 Tax=Polymorphobacter multimanifer TaxID=1070431 RepID=A0A841L8E4_9SPHN|nr:c-type cytochrome [Polymorphobacter multimanifer]MBB6227841.1 cytochrome c [Polymorphobacter multimanifer]GGI77402.1 cytochrome c [Polymorphobacter multimanifer]
MDSFEFNKVAGATLAACVALLGISIVTGEAFTPHLPEKQGWAVEGVPEEVADAGPAAEAERPIAFYLATATPEQGEAAFKKCAACHNAAAGGANGIGPNLHGIVGAPHASKPGFSYSAALTAMKGQPWTWDELSAWLKNPRAYAEGNKMSFAGLSRPQERASVMLWLNSQSANPLPLPAVPAEEAPAEAAPAEGEAPADDAAPAEEAAAPETAA